MEPDSSSKNGMVITLPNKYIHWALKNGEWLRITRSIHTLQSANLKLLFTMPKPKKVNGIMALGFLSLQNIFLQSRTCLKYRGLKTLSNRLKYSFIQSPWTLIIHLIKASKQLFFISIKHIISWTNIIEDPTIV
jgi:hypothetical protein